MGLPFFFLVVAVIIYVQASAFNTSAVETDVERRRLQSLGGLMGGGQSGGSNRRDIKKSTAKLERIKRLLRTIEAVPPPSNLKPDASSPPHTRKGPAIFAAAMSIDSTKADANMFVGTARKGGYDGDIVVAVLPNSRADFMEVLKKHKCIVYTVNPECTGDHHDKVCSFQGQDQKIKTSINMVRYYLYQWWGLRYDENALVMLSDFRDVLFQGNPFTYRTWEWAPPVSQLVVFQEAYPNKVIYRCVFNGGWIENCYGAEGLRRVGSNTVSCSGVSMGTRDAIVVYAHLITQQLDPRVRYGRNTTMTNKNCISLGMDQGFHNWLVYSGQLDKYMDIKVTNLALFPFFHFMSPFIHSFIHSFPISCRTRRGQSSQRPPFLQLTSYIFLSNSKGIPAGRGPCEHSWRFFR